tara:strand:+ start:2090 stop:4210 length:2121 start_codon:yes stop_codon:yes gene_type:complete
MKNQIENFLIACCFISFFGCEKSNKSQDFNSVPYPENLKTLHENVIQYYLDMPVDSIHVEELLNDLQDDGSWPSIDYTNRIRGGWPVKIHLEYVQTLAIAYNKKGSEYYHDKNLSKKIHLSLNYWLTNDFLSPNWHDQHIGVPERLLPTLFLMENELSKKQLDQAMVLLQRAKIKMTGQNKVWLSTNVMLRSLLLRKSDSVAIASKAIQDELQIAKGVGIKADWSYHEHGAQLQFGNYGLSYLEDMIKSYTFVSDTPFQFADNKIEVLRNYILKGQQWVIWNGKYDISASGRQLFPDEQTKKYKRLKASILKMKLLDEAYSSEYDDALDSKIHLGNKHFWKSDFHVHRRKDFYFSVKMSSQRIIGTESVNQENIQGYYMGDGVSLLYSNGEEYNNIFPFWDWKKLPGTTVIQDTSKLPIIKAWDFETNGTFVGGVTNGKNGIAVMDYDRDGLKAHKSWFMFDDMMVCLGAGINAKTKFPVTTSINQVFLKNDLVISENNKFFEKTEKNESLKPDWVRHDGTGYFFPNGGLVKIESRFLEGSWNRVAKRYRPVILTESILKMWIDHGSNPKNADYAYVLVPHATKEQLVALKETPPFKIVNGKAQQTVETTDGSMAGIVFYSAGKSKIFGGISVDKPCVTMLENQQDGIKFAISDPSQKLTEIEVSIKGHYNVEGGIYTNGQTLFKVNLPKGDEAGRTMMLLLNENH